MNKLFKKFAAVSAMALLVMGIFVYPIQKANALGRDCDSNAIIYCGVLNKTELYNALNKGTGRQYQSSAELKNLFGTYGIYTKDFESPNLVEGYVTRDNHVVVPGRTISNGSNVYSMGRSYMTGSTRLTQFPYPVYLRHPSVSFRSDSIPAYVMLNPDGTFAYAIIKSCGNIVPGRLYKASATPAYILYALKWLDSDADGHWDANEGRHGGVTFRLTGNGVNRTAVTDYMGYAWFYGLPAGTYTLTETVPNGYFPTTAATQTVVAAGASGSRIGKVFGNAPYRKLTVWKFEDLNRDSHKQASENFIPNWTFDITGPRGYRSTVNTTANGGITLTRLVPGTYTVTERSQNGWEATTRTIQTADLVSGDKSLYYGNVRFTEPEYAALTVYKYHDRDGDRVQDGNEERLSGWRFRVTGPNTDTILTTDAQGVASLNHLDPGHYTVTEILTTGWRNTTGLSVTRDIPAGSTATYVYGNRRVTERRTPGGEIKPTKLPTSGPAEEAAMAFGTVSFSGVALAWARSKKRLLGAFRK